MMLFASYAGLILCTNRGLVGWVVAIGETQHLEDCSI